MARRRFQDPKPFRRGAWWYLRPWKSVFVAGREVRKRGWVKLAPASMPEREVLKIAAEHLRPINQGLESLGSATNFQHYVDTVYIPVVLPTMASSTQARCKAVLRIYLEPAFGNLCLRDITTLTIQRYISGLATATVAKKIGDETVQRPMAQESKDKIRDVLSSVLRSAVQYGLLVKNPVEGVHLPAQKTGRRTVKPFIYPGQFEQLLVKIAEPYATMVYVAIYTGLRISELAGLKWNDVHHDVITNLVGGERVQEHVHSITIDERYSRGDWGAPKSEASNVTVGVERRVFERIHRLKLLSVEVRAGRAKRKFRVVKADGPEDLIFQSVQGGRPMRDNNILSRHLKPAARAVGLPWVNWRVLRRSFGTWLKMAGVDVKDAQALMRHSRASTTMDIYIQHVPESQRRAVDRLGSLSTMVS